MRIVCACCKSRRHCKFRQPGTWVVDCELFDEDARATIGAAPRRLAEAELQEAGQPARIGAGARLPGR